MENSKLLTILTEVDEGTKTPFKAHNEILFLFGVSKCTILDELFYKCAETQPNLSREEFNEVLKLWIYRWEKDQQGKQIMKGL